MLKEGDQAPDFTLPTDGEGSVTLSDLRGSKVILYFYPKDDTSGCTAQACEYRDILPRIEEKGARVLGISPDPVASHDKFKAKYDLNFPLLVDEDHQVAEAYGVWKEKSMYGRTFWGVERSTFLVDEEGRIARAWRKTRAKGDAERALAEL
jgi:thioredoxin-dependent peroxiredoxin